MKIEKEYSIFRIILPCIYIFYSIFMEMVCFLWLGFSAFPKYFLFDIAIILFLAGFLYLFKNIKWQNAFFYIFISFHAIMNAVNATMYNIFGDILSFDLLSLGGEATAAATAEFIDWAGLFLNLAILIVFIVITAICQKKIRKTYKIKNLSTATATIALVLLLQSFSFTLYQIQKSTLETNANQNISDIVADDFYLYENFQFKIDAFKNFGYYGFYFKSICDLIFTENISAEETNKIRQQYLNSWTEPDSNAPLYDDNLIVILCESLDWYAIDPFNTPTLWKIFNGENSSFYATNFHARNRTNNSEGIVLLGNMPRETSLTSIVRNGYELSFSLPNVFKDSSSLPTKTSYLHCNYETFYNRNVTHGTNGVGFDELYTYDDYEGEFEFVAFKQWISDVEFFKYFEDEILPTDQRFLTFFSTISTHGPYDDQNKYFTEYYEKYYANLDEYKIWLEENTDFIYPTDEYTKTLFDNYKCANMDFDKTVEYILKQLEERNLTENTSIVFFADHNSYYNNLCYDIKGVDKEDFSNIYINNIPFAIYSPALEKVYNGNKEITTFTNTFDVLPTICDLYGLKSNTLMYQGYSMFSDEIENSFFSSNLNGMFNDKIYSLNIEDIYYEGEVTEEEIKKFTENAIKFYEKQYIIEKSYEYNIQ